jgi:hypothetical protein
MESDFLTRYFYLGYIPFELRFDGRFRDVVGSFFLGWPDTPQKPGQSTRGLEAISQSVLPPVKIKLTVLEFQAKHPQEKLIYAGDPHDLERGYQSLQVFQVGAQTVLAFSSWGSVTIQDISSKSTDLIKITVSSASPALPLAIFEDMLYAGLAPVLRRLGYFLIHAFATVKDGKALLLVGESGSGKTTTGLTLCRLGWGYLANDVVILHNNRDGIFAYPTPGAIGLAEQTDQPMMSTADDLRATGTGPGLIKRYIPASNVTGGWAARARVEAILFPQITDADSSRLDEIERPLLLAQLMENSIDGWDIDSLSDHTDFLHKLATQAKGFRLSLARGAKEDPSYLDSIMPV